MRIKQIAHTYYMHDVPGITQQLTMHHTSLSSSWLLAYLTLTTTRVDHYHHLHFTEGESWIIRPPPDSDGGWHSRQVSGLRVRAPSCCAVLSSVPLRSHLWPSISLLWPHVPRSSCRGDHLTASIWGQTCILGGELLCLCLRGSPWSENSLWVRSV